MQKGWVAKCDASPLGLFSFQSAKQNPNFFSRKYKDFLPLKTDAMIIKQMQKSSRKNDPIYAKISRNADR